MFASIPEFDTVYSEDDINHRGKEWIRLLNEMFHEFDMVFTPLWDSSGPWCLNRVAYFVAFGATRICWSRENQNDWEHLYGCYWAQRGCLFVVVVVVVYFVV